MRRKRVAFKVTYLAILTACRELSTIFFLRTGTADDLMSYIDGTARQTPANSHQTCTDEMVNQNRPMAFREYDPLDDDPIIHKSLLVSQPFYREAYFFRRHVQRFPCGGSSVKLDFRPKSEAGAIGG